MATQLRFVPTTEAEGHLVLTSMRCLQSRYLLTPSAQLNSLVTGVLAKASQKYGVGVCLPAVLSNHIHLLLVVRDAEQLARFENFVNSNIAREIGSLHGWTGKFWEKRYSLDLVTLEEAAQVRLLKYLLAHGCKENLVSRPQDWPGVNPARALLSGRPLRGSWVNRTHLYNARRRVNSGATIRPIDFAEELELELIPLPCWSHLPEEEYRLRVRDLIGAIEEETELRHRSKGSRPLGRRAVLRRHPHHRPDYTKRSPHRGIIAATLRARQELLSARQEFVRAYRAASERLRSGDLRARFPEGCFPPPLPFVRASPSA